MSGFVSTVRLVSVLGAHDREMRPTPPEPLLDPDQPRATVRPRARPGITTVDETVVPPLVAVPLDWVPPRSEPSPEQGWWVDHQWELDLRCDMCEGRPAIHVRLRRIVGFLLGWAVHSDEAILCRDCGTALVHNAQNRTMLSGWWGPIPLLLNLWAITANALVARRLARLGLPDRPASAFVMRSRAPLRRRPGPWVMVAVLALLGVGTTIALDQRDSGVSPQAQALVGACLSAEDAGAMRTVACASPHTGRITAVLHDRAACAGQQVGELPFRDRGSSIYACITGTFRAGSPGRASAPP